MEASDAVKNVTVASSAPANMEPEHSAPVANGQITVTCL
jgi:hypothetical protein